MARTSILASIACLLICQQASPIDKADLLSSYRNKFVVVTKEGLSTHLYAGLRLGTLQIPINEAGGAGPPNLIFGSTGLDVGRGSPGIATGSACGFERIHVGEVLKVSLVSQSGRVLDIDLTVFPHPAQCGTPPGPITMEMGSTELAIQASKGSGVDNADALAALAAQWLAPFDTVADVEKALGAPQTHVDMGDKVLYKYKDMTVELQAGKVTDVRR